MRSSGVRGLLVYCANYRCGRLAKLSADRCRDQIRLPDLDPLFVCQACGTRGADIGPDPQFVQPTENPPERTGGLCPRATSSSSYIFFAFFFFLPFVVAFAIAALGPVAAIGAVASDPDFATAPPLVPLAPPVCAMAPAADNASAMAATGMISTRIIILPFKCVPVPKTVCSNRSDA